MSPEAARSGSWEVALESGEAHRRCLPDPNRDRSTRVGSDLGPVGRSPFVSSCRSSHCMSLAPDHADHRFYRTSSGSVSPYTAAITSFTVKFALRIDWLVGDLVSLGQRTLCARRCETSVGAF